MCMDTPLATSRQSLGIEISPVKCDNSTKTFISNSKRGPPPPMTNQQRCHHAPYTASGNELATNCFIPNKELPGHLYFHSQQC